MDTLSAVSHLKYSERELLSFLLSHAAAGENPVALWRLPASGLTHLVISDNYVEVDREEFVEELDAGFLIAPFDKSRQRLYLKADQFFTFENGNLKPHTTSLEEASAQWLRDKLPSMKVEQYKPRRVHAMNPADGSKESFLEIIQKAVAEIEEGNLEKIVPSRTRTITLSDEFDVIEGFQKLCLVYPQALISFVSIPGVGNWLGASPEILVSVKDKTIFKTVALAGTLPFQPDTDLRSVAWTQKEIEEQALVERYVISCFKRVRLREYEEHGPKTVVAGNLMHLKSEFTVDMKATNFPQIGSVMLDLLHPTSAVCGMPLEPSLNFLKKHEGYDRGFYAGYLGPINIYNNIELFVNLRCMQLSGSQGILYAGAGVTVDSIPEKEWSETEMKFDTLLNVIF
jgi:isochorismate synthase